MHKWSVSLIALLLVGMVPHSLAARAISGPVSARDFAPAAPPRVVKAVPDNGDIGVDPALTEIRVTFDEPMNISGRSIVGGGDAFPKIVGTIHWIDRTTIVIPVILEPDHEYWLSINSERFRNFQSVRGESAVPYPIRFRTAGEAHADDAGEGAKARAECNAAAVDRLEELLTACYAHRDRLGIDWVKLLDEHREALVQTDSAESFAHAAATLLARAQDKHLAFEVKGGARLPTFVRPQVPNVNPTLLPELVPGYERLSEVVAVGRWDDGVGYIQINSWGGSDRDAVEACYEALWRLHDAKSIIVDVRLNGGGSETLAKGFAGCFIDEPVLYAQNLSVDPVTPDGYRPVFDRWLKPSTRRPRFTGSVVVLSGPVVMSSNEAFILMMKAAPRATVVGGRTQGSSGNPKPFDLGNGVTVLLPSWQAMTPAGKPFEGVGIEPDVPVEVNPAQLRTHDPVLERAREILGG
jgi:peptidase S41-like protein